MQSFVKLREMVASNKDLAERLERLESLSRDHSSVINLLAEEIEFMKATPIPPARRIGFPAD